MDIQLPDQVEGSNRRFFSNDGTPIIIDYTENGEPLAAHRLGTQDGGFKWRPLEEDVFLELYNEGHEIHDMYDFDDVIEAFVEARMPSTDQGMDLGA